MSLTIAFSTNLSTKSAGNSVGFTFRRLDLKSTHRDLSLIPILSGAAGAEPLL